MILLANLLHAIGYILNIAIMIYIWIVIIRVFLPWIGADPYNPVVSFINSITDPPLRLLQRYIPPVGGVDLSPLALIFALIFVKIFVVKTILQIGYSLSSGY